MAQISLGRVVPIIKVGTVTTLEPNQNATVTETTSGNETFFNFGIPRGENSDASIFNGTQEEYEAQKDTVEDGTVVNITDDLTENGVAIEEDILNRVTTIEDTVTNLETNKVNKSDILSTMADVSATTETNYLAGATAVKELNSKLGKQIKQIVEVKVVSDNLASNASGTKTVNLTSYGFVNRPYPFAIGTRYVQSWVSTISTTQMTVGFHNPCPTARAGEAYYYLVEFK